MSHDLTRGVRGAGSVTGSAIQIAFHLGFDPIYLIGCDAAYKVLDSVNQSGDDQFNTGVKLHLTSTQDDDPNHFDPSYFGTGRRWHDPNVQRMIEGYEQCRDGIRGTGRQIINATVGGNLEVFPRVDIHDLFPKRTAVRVPDLPAANIEPKATIDPTERPNTTASAAPAMHHAPILTPPNEAILIPDAPEADHAAVEEVEIVKRLLDARGVDPARAVMLDVGAHIGNALASFADAGWRVHALEPDHNNRAGLVRRNKPAWRLTIDPRAVSDRSGLELGFFTSPVSSGISALAPFVDSHTESQKVTTVTLDDYCREHDLKRIDLLKTDTEGFDLMALKGFPWDRLAPAAIVCEFEDAKSVPLGYTHAHLAEFLRDKGYDVYVSEWRPIITYGLRHRWRRLTRWPTSLADPMAWGNLIAFKRDPNETLHTPPTRAEIIDATHTAIRASHGRYIKELANTIGDLEQRAKTPSA
ncbi:MAG: FkbM family methyltransferase, partial [Planctomycetota bacterium]